VSLRDQLEAGPVTDHGDGPAFLKYFGLKPDDVSGD